uniref:(northern house mosquito) hypothetical protein n=1 Tax=Culex pipiens TaxID=7175 RepID=A0A8D8GME9_CULPI
MRGRAVRHDERGGDWTCGRGVPPARSGLRLHADGQAGEQAGGKRAGCGQSEREYGQVEADAPRDAPPQRDHHRVAAGAGTGRQFRRPIRQSKASLRRAVLRPGLHLRRV